MQLVKKSGLKIQKSYGEKIISSLKECRILDKNLKIKKNENFIFVPLERYPSNEVLHKIKRIRKDITVGEFDFQEREDDIKTLEKLLENKIGTKNLDKLPKSLDIVGDIAIIELSQDIEMYKKEIGKAILSNIKKINTVLIKKSPISTKFRLRDYECIAGIDRTLTIHKEFGCEFIVDLSKAYFSPRLSFEHDRIASNVIDGEVIIDMFAGVGPFSILIAKRHERIKVYAIDINPEAMKYLVKNIVHNKVKRKVTAIFGDTRYISTKHLQSVASRIIMNLPSESFNYVRFACNALRKKGGIIHFYAFMDDSGLLEDKVKELKEEISLSKRNLTKIIHAREIKEIAPRIKQIVIDAKVI